MIDWSSCPAVERDADRVSGAWAFRGTRVPVAALFENVEEGATIQNFLEWFPGVTAHQVSTAFELNWGMLKNGNLLSEAEATGFEILVTTDQNLRYQQNLGARRIAVVVIGSTSWPRIKKGVAAVVDAINDVKPGGYIEVAIP